MVSSAGKSSCLNSLHYEEVGEMTKTDIVEKIAKETKVTKSIAAKAFEVVVGSVKDALQKGDKVSIVGFGTFGVATRKARKGRNPKTGQEIKIAAKKSPKFTPGKNLKEIVNGPAKAKPKKAK
jgi:DNA-binding protein HU-beta